MNSSFHNYFMVETFSEKAARIEVRAKTREKKRETEEFGCFSYLSATKSAGHNV